MQLLSVIMIILRKPVEQQLEWEYQKQMLADPELEKKLQDYPLGSADVHLVYAFKQRVSEYGKEHYHPTLCQNLGEACVAFVGYSLDWLEAVQFGMKSKNLEQRMVEM